MGMHPASVALGNSLGIATASRPVFVKVISRTVDGGSVSGAVELGAKVLLLGDRSADGGQQFMGLQQATDAGAIVVTERLTANIIDEPLYQGRVIGVIPIRSNGRTKSGEPSVSVPPQFARSLIAAPGLDTLMGACGETDNCYNPGVHDGAAAMVAAAVALIWSKYPTLTPESVIKRLVDSATDLGAPGYDSAYGHGMLNIRKALAP